MKFRLDIRNRIVLSFLSVIVILILTTYYSSSVLKEGIGIVKTIQNEEDPSMEAIVKLDELITANRMYITNWVYLPTNTEDKNGLKRILSEDYPALKVTIDTLKQNWDSLSAAHIDSVVLKFDSLITLCQAKIVEILQNDDDYMFNQMDAGTSLDKYVFPMTADIKRKLNIIYESRMEESLNLKSEMAASFDNLATVLWILLGVSAILAISISLFTSKILREPIFRLKFVVDKMKEGEIAEKVTITTNDEIGDMGHAVNNLIDGMERYATFADEVGNGNLTAEFDRLGEKDTIGNALLNMRNNLRKIAEEDRQRSWVTEGLAKFAEILRNNSDDTENFGKTIISHLVKYLGVNQGGIYVAEENKEGENVLVLKGCYAYERDKFKDHEVMEGEGLIGQSWQEGEPIYLTEIPDDYINITSGLGKAVPTSILIVPLKVNDDILGVIELASFEELAKHERDFVFKISETIAATISTVKTTERTTALLHESKVMSENLRAQEEEMRQTMEEMQATQESNETDKLNLLEELKVVKKENASLLSKIEGSSE